MAATKVNNETLKSTLEAGDEFYVNAVGNLDRKGRVDGIRVTNSQVTDFDNGITNNAAVLLNTAKTSNATHTGDATGSTVLTISNNAVSNAKAANIATNTIKGRITAATGDPEDLTAANVRTIINVSDGANNYTHPNHSGDVTSVADGATTISTGVVDIAHHSATGTPSGTTFYRGDNTWAIPSGGGDALVANPLSQFAATTSLQLKGVISDETGSGALVFGTSPTLVTPVLGTPASGTLTNCTSIPAGQLTGSIADARLSSNVPLLDFNNTFTAVQTLQSSSGTSGLAIRSDSLSAFTVTTYSNTGNSIWTSQRTRGTLASPTGVIDTDVIGDTQTLAHDGTSFVINSSIKTIINGTVSTGVLPTDLIFSVHDGTSVVEAIRIVKDKSLKLSGQLNINGNTILNTGTLTLPTSTDTLIGKATTDVLTNKTLDANATGNSISNIDIADHSATGTPDSTTFYRGDNTWATPAGSGDMVLASAQTVTGAKTFNDTKLLLRNVANSFNGSFVNTNTADRIYTLQDSSDTLVGLATTDTLLNKTLTSPTITTPAITGNTTTTGLIDGRDVATDGTKLDGIATSATANDTDANLKNRANHTGTQTASTISDYASATATFTNKIIDESATGNTIKIRRGVQTVLFDFTTDVTTGNGKFYFHIDPSLAGNDLIDVHAEVITAGTTGTTDIQIANVTQAVDMLSTKLTIDTAETGSDTAATPAVIDTANDDVAENDLIRIDVDAISTTAPKGLIVTLGFRSP